MATPLPVRVCALITLILISCTGKSSSEDEPYKIEETAIPVDSFFSYSFIPSTYASPILLAGEKEKYEAIAFIDFDLDTLTYDSLFLRFIFIDSVQGKMTLRRIKEGWEEASISWNDTSIIGEVYKELDIDGDSVRLKVDTSILEHGIAILSDTFLRIRERVIIAFHEDERKSFEPSKDAFLIELEEREDTTSYFVLGKGVPFRVYIHKPEIPEFKQVLHAGLILDTPDTVSIPIEVWGETRYHTGRIENGENEIDIYDAINDTLNEFTIRVQDELDDAWKKEIEIDTLFIYLIYIPEEEE